MPRCTGKLSHCQSSERSICDAEIIESVVWHQRYIQPPNGLVHVVLNGTWVVRCPGHIDAAGSVKRNRTGSDIEDGQVATVLIIVFSVDYTISVDVVKLSISIGVDSISGTGVERRSGQLPIMDIERVGEGSPDVGFGRRGGSIVPIGADVLCFADHTNGGSFTDGI